MALPLLRTAAIAFALFAVCSACSPPPPEERTDLPESFRDPFGRTPVALSLTSGSQLRISYVDSLFLRRTPDEQRQQAHAIARYLWEAFGASQGVNFVSVAFSDLRRKRPSARLTTHTFLFYPDELGVTRGEPASSRR